MISRLSNISTSFHLLLYSIAFGGSFFHSFIVSPIAFKTLPKSDFGNMQNKIFPRYFIGQTITPVILGLTAPVVLTPWTIGVLATSSVGGAINYFVLLPVTHKVKAEQERLVAENRAYDDEGNPTPEYAAATKKFGKYHGMSMLANLVSIVSLGGYGILLSRKLL